MKLRTQHKLALALLDWHSGQSSPLYAVSSCMLSDSMKGITYLPANHAGHAEDEAKDSAGALRMAIFELRGLKKNANFPEAVTPANEKDCNALADKLEKLTN